MSSNPTPEPIPYVDRAGAVSGALLDSFNLNTAIPAQSYLSAASMIPTVGGSSLTLTQPAVNAVINTGSAVMAVTVTQQPLTFAATKDTYVDLVMGVTGTATYTLVPVTVGSAEPPLTSNSLRLYRVTTTSSTVISVQQLATQCPINPLMIQADPVESTTFVPYTPTSATHPLGTILDNLARIRASIALMLGGPWNAAFQLLATSSLGQPNGPASLNPSGQVVQLPAGRGQANGVAATDGSNRVSQVPANGIRQEATTNSPFGVTPATGAPSNIGSALTLTLPTTSNIHIFGFIQLQSNGPNPTEVDVGYTVDGGSFNLLARQSVPPDYSGTGSNGLSHAYTTMCFGTGFGVNAGSHTVQFKAQAVGTTGGYPIVLSGFLRAEEVNP